jgi:hypothetical protein
LQELVTKHTDNLPIGFKFVSEIHESLLKQELGIHYKQWQLINANDGVAG